MEEVVCNLVNMSDQLSDQNPVLPQPLIDHHFVEAGEAATGFLVVMDEEVDNAEYHVVDGV